MKIYLDLLPKERKLELKRKKTFRIVLRHEMLFLLPLMVLAVVLANVYYLLSFQLDNTVKSGSEEKYEKLNAYEEKFKQVNEATASLMKITAGHLQWSNVFERLNVIIPEDVTIINFSTKDYNVFIVGKAKNRDVLLRFKSNLESDECFSNVNVPLSNLVVKENIDFQIDFLFKSDCLKEIR